MAPIGPIARVLIQTAVMGISILARALPAAYGAALRNAQKGGIDAKSAEKVGMFLKKQMKKDEALSVLNLQDVKGDGIDLEMVQKQYDKYFAANAVEKGGSFYLQSKIYRAKEMLDEYIKEKKAEKEEEEEKKKKEAQGKSKENHNE